MEPITTVTQIELKEIQYNIVHVSTLSVLSTTNEALVLNRQSALMAPVRGFHHGLRFQYWCMGSNKLNWSTALDSRVADYACTSGKR